MQKDSSLYLFGWINQFRAISGALWGYCLGICTGKSCCHWYFCKPQWVIGPMQKESSLYLFGWITPWGGPLWGYCLGPGTGKSCCRCYFHQKYPPGSNIQQVLSLYLFSWINLFLTPYSVTPQAACTGCDPAAIWNIKSWPYTNITRPSNLLYLFGWINALGSRSIPVPTLTHTRLRMQRAHALYMHTRTHLDTHQIAHAAGTIHQRDRAIGTWERGFHVLNNPYWPLGDHWPNYVNTTYEAWSKDVTDKIWH